MKYIQQTIACTLFILLLLTSCSKPSVPSSFTESDELVAIYPDYVDVTVPANIAPLHFHIDQEADDYVTRLYAGSEEWLTDEADVCPDSKDWKSLTQAALDTNDGNINVEIYIQTNGSWTRCKPFTIHVEKEPIDPYISYRLISPSYVTYEDLTLNQRCLENFDESLIYGNMIHADYYDDTFDDKSGQCINCHHTQWYNPKRLQFHVRQYLGGTVIAYDGDIKKVNLKTDATLSAGVYPTWHPKKPYIVYSTNLTGQSFHTRDIQKIEVQDNKSNLIFYDFEKNEVTPITNDSTWLDCFPFWSPDGKYIYYVSAHWNRLNSTDARDFELIKNYKNVQYNLYRRPFNEDTHTFGPRELMYDAVSRNRSVTLPRISPDGRWLMFTEGNFGVFHIWHSEADLYLMDLSLATPLPDTLRTQQIFVDSIPEEYINDRTTNVDRERIADSLRTVQASAYSMPHYIRPIDEINSDNVESYHSWSSNGHWVVFSSRRVDGNFTRPFIAYFDGEGHFGKPFELPQDNPQYHREFMRSFNIPEFMSGPVTISPQEFAEIIGKDAINAELNKNYKTKADGQSGASQQKPDGQSGASPQHK